MTPVERAARALWAESPGRPMHAADPSPSMQVQDGEPDWQRFIQQAEDLLLAKGGVETERGTVASLRYEELAEAGYIKEATLTENGVAWRLSSRGAAIVYSDDSDTMLEEGR